MNRRALLGPLVMFLVVLGGCVDDESTSLAANAQSECLEQRAFNDRLQPNDLCWDPPQNYCASGGSTILTKGCAPDFGICCQFATSCIPCGWVTCWQLADGTTDPPDCADVEINQLRCEEEVSMPSEDPFCL